MDGVKRRMKVWMVEFWRFSYGSGRFWWVLWLLRFAVSEGYRVD